MAASDTSFFIRIVRVHSWLNGLVRVRQRKSAVRRVFNFGFNTSCSSRPNFAFSHAIERQIPCVLPLQPPIERHLSFLAIAQGRGDLKVGQGPHLFRHISVFPDALRAAQSEPRQPVKNFKGYGKSPVQVVGCLVESGLRVWINAATAGLRRIMGTYNFGTSHVASPVGDFGQGRISVQPLLRLALFIPHRI